MAERTPSISDKLQSVAHDGIELTTATNGDTGQTNVVERNSSDRDGDDAPYEGDLLSGLNPKRMVVDNSGDSQEGGAIVSSLTEMGNQINEIRNMKYSHW